MGTFLNLLEIYTYLRLPKVRTKPAGSLLQLNLTPVGMIYIATTVFPKNITSPALKSGEWMLMTLNCPPQGCKHCEKSPFE